MTLCAQIAAEKTLYSFDQAFDYEIPPHLISAAVPGVRVMIPFGRSNALRVGMILSVAEKEPPGNVKPIRSVIDRAPILSPELLSLALWMHERYFCTIFDAVKAMVPAGMRYRMKEFCFVGKTSPEDPAEQAVWDDLQKKPREKNELIARFSLSEESFDALLNAGVIELRSEPIRAVGDAIRKKVRHLPYEGKLTEKQELAYSCLCDLGAVTLREAVYYAGVGEGVFETLVKKGAAEFFEEEVYRNPYRDIDRFGEVEAPVLSKEQQAVYKGLEKSLTSGAYSSALLYGVTGSGKTSVYLKLIDRALSMSRGVIVMVPEISLTPQTAAIFYRRYGERVAVFHSALSLGERLDEFKRVQSGKADIAIGTRSAIFAPVQNLGLIVMDEEQEGTYKSEMSPRYHAADAARFRCASNQALFLMTSATPSVETMYLAKTGACALWRLENRYGEARFPKTTVADMNEERLAGNATNYSRALYEAIADRLKKKEQSILLLNRRGYNTFAVCTACKTVVTCPRCSISLKYHSANSRLMCHYCGYSIRYTDVCPTCSEKKLSYRGFGTQRAEEELRELFPEARILRVDTDSAMSRARFENDMEAFRRGEYDLLVGTQMVAKGLDFEKVTLVGVLSADQSLYAEDFRSNERAFDLFTQVIGRSGRGKYEGEAILQTFTPENPVIALSKVQDYDAFYQTEIEYRRAMLYPPFSDFCVISFTGRDESLAQRCAGDFLTKLGALAKREYASLPLRVLSPSAASVSKINFEYRYRLLIKCRNSRPLREMIRRLLLEFLKDRTYSEIRLVAEINPDLVL